MSSVRSRPPPPDWKTMHCLHCNKPHTNDKFCSVTCQNASQNDTKRREFLEGKYLGKHLQYRGWARSMVEEILGRTCCGCGIGKEYNGKPLTLQVNHKDGDATHNVIENIELLCPNCHSQTANYGRKNKVSTRDWRRKNFPTVCPGLSSI